MTIGNVDSSADLPSEVRLGLIVNDEDNNGYWHERYGVGYVRFPEGADFDIIYQNAIVPPTPTIIHAHGLTPPQGLDGVPFISALPLESGQSIRYTFALESHNRGTYWLHSHYAFQRTQGVLAPLIVEGNHGYLYEEELNDAQDEVVVLEDYCLYGEAEDGPNVARDSEIVCYPPEKVFQSLQNDYYNDPPPPKTCPGIAPATDFDVNWHYTLINGQPLANPIRMAVQPEASFLRLRFLNAASTTNFLVSLPFDAQIIAADGQFVVPVSITETGALPFSFWLAVGQRIDLLINLTAIRPTLRTSTQVIYSYSESDTLSQVAAIILDFSQNRIPWQAPNSTFAAGFMQFQTELALHAYYPSFPSSDLPIPTRQLLLNLTGDNGFNSINGYGYQLPPAVPYSPNPHPLLIEYNDIVAITFSNQNNDPHPFHVHHVSFQVINIDGQPLSHGAVRDTILIPGGCHNVTVLFQATSPGIWPIHCHNEFHQMAGMFTTLQYMIQI